MAKPIKTSEKAYRAYRDALAKMVDKIANADTTAQIDALIAEAVAVWGVAAKTIEESVLLQIRKNIKSDAKKRLQPPLLKKLNSIQSGQVAETYARWNAELIRDVAETERMMIAEEVAKVATEDMPKLSDRIARVVSVTQSRAKLIARDQTAKLNSDLQSQKHRALGLKYYFWSSSLDEKTRPNHLDIDGERYEYGQVTDETDGHEPGQAINCRCVARPDFDSLDEDTIDESPQNDEDN